MYDKFAATAANSDDGDRRPTRAQAEEAIRTLIRWAGDDPDRAEVRETPARVARAYDQWFDGYDADIPSYLARTFEETGGYGGPVAQHNIAYTSFCEHHLAPVRGRAHIAYIPAGRVVGLSKLVRLVEAFAHRLQLQERMTVQIAHALAGHLQPAGVAVVLHAEHDCMATRGVHARGTTTVTQCTLGRYSDDENLWSSFQADIRLQLA